MTVSLHITNREQRGHALEKVREAGGLPGVVYGPKQEAIAVTLDKREFDKVFKEAGESTIINLEGLEEPIEALVQNVDFAPTKGGIVHVDFYAIERGKEMTTVIPLVYIGESPAEKEGAVITKVLHEVEITCKPSRLPRNIEVDITALAAIDDRLTIADLTVPEGVVINDEAENVVAIASEHKEEAEDEEPADISEVEVEQKGKQEEEVAE